MERPARAGRRPKAVIPTDLYGQACDLDAIIQVSADYGVPVICDSAEAVGTLYKGRPAGQGARAAAYSFNGNKIITTSGGGMLVSNDAKLVASIVARVKTFDFLAKDVAVVTVNYPIEFLP